MRFNKCYFREGLTEHHDSHGHYKSLDEIIKFLIFLSYFPIAANNNNLSMSVEEITNIAIAMILRLL